MTQKSLHLRLGIAVSLGALFLILHAIPNYVYAPSNVRNIILSPLFWPYVVAGLTAIIGLSLLFTAFRPGEDVPFENEDVVHSDGITPWLRLAGLGAIMLVTMFALPRVGMVWTTMLVFVACAFMFRTRHPIAAVVCAVVVPLLLYAFFAHVAGVAIPQGDFVRLP
ncbi:tripartite tricarboxylate transporter TctB family protein [Marivita sp.]|uniref:tripartite tricarboxylate transporter TctB family protein n=1 Tax=Marivita sp. TaxID=2003365 RepID=UPI0025C32A1F|nr:tripartite tricarboxylate transporter TctB family protein [Marivita sp.]